MKKLTLQSVKAALTSIDDTISPIMDMMLSHPLYTMGTLAENIGSPKNWTNPKIKDAIEQTYDQYNAKFPQPGAELEEYLMDMKIKLAQEDVPYEKRYL